jgi:hypothetical protein
MGRLAKRARVGWQPAEASAMLPHRKIQPAPDRVCMTSLNVPDVSICADSTEGAYRHIRRSGSRVSDGIEHDKRYRHQQDE